MAKDGDAAFQPTGAGAAAEGVEAVLADKAAAGPGAVADEVDAALAAGDAVAGKLQIQAAHQEGFDASRQGFGLIKAEAEQHHVVHIAAIFRYAQFALDVVIHRVEVDQGVKLTQQIADGDADGFAVVGKQHHQVNETAVFDFAFDEAAQDGPVDAVEELAHVEL
jgi:hypothetical protein